MSEKQSTSDLPLAYTEGHTWFYGRKFFTDQRALIPRPETEAIIDAIKALFYRRKHFPDQAKPAIADIGTGSGIIAITLALELPEAHITASDISPKALSLARENSALHGTPNINFQQSDLFSNIPSTFDIIIANLPYVDDSWPWLDKTALSHEPSGALYAKDHGLALIKKLISVSRPHLTASSSLFLEHDPSQYAELSSFAAQYSFSPTSVTPYVTRLQPQPA